MNSHTLQECIMDMSFIGNFYDNFYEKYPEVELIGTFYNIEDMLAAKGINNDKIDGRLKSMKSTLGKLNRESIILNEPFFEIIEENYPGIRIGRTLFNRYETFLPMITKILDYGENVAQEIKDAIISYSQINYPKKIKQIKIFQQHTKKIKGEIIKEGKDANDITNWIPKVTSSLKGVIYEYATKGNFLPSNFEPNMDTFSVASCELFIHSIAVFLQNKSGATSPELNDNIDILTLLYVRNGRRLLTHDRKWIEIIQNTGLAEKYLHPLK